MKKWYLCLRLKKQYARSVPQFAKLFHLVFEYPMQHLVFDFPSKSFISRRPSKEDIHTQRLPTPQLFEQVFPVRTEQVVVELVLKLERALVRCLCSRLYEQSIARNPKKSIINPKKSRRNLKKSCRNPLKSIEINRHPEKSFRNLLESLRNR